jgi:hypothetical protein
MLKLENNLAIIKERSKHGSIQQINATENFSSTDSKAKEQFDDN